MRTRPIKQPEAHLLDPRPPGTSPIHRPGVDFVTYHIPTSPPSTSSPSSKLKTTIHLHPTSHWTSGLHFHTTHTEHLRLVRGSITVRLGTTLNTYSASAGGQIDAQCRVVAPGLIITVPKYVRHNWGRADHMLRRSRIGGSGKLPDDWSDDVVVEEWTDPSDSTKPLFFWNLNGVITASADDPKSAPQMVARWMLGGWWIPFQLFVIFWELDNWPVFLSLEGGNEAGLWLWLWQSVEFVMTFLVLFGASLVGRVLGVKAVVKERTPKELWDAWQKDKNGGSKVH